MKTGYLGTAVDGGDSDTLGERGDTPMPKRIDVAPAETTAPPWTQRECDQCGREDWPGWIGDFCPGIREYGDCDGLLKPVKRCGRCGEPWRACMLRGVCERDEQ